MIEPAIEEILEALYLCEFENEAYPAVGDPDAASRAESRGLVEPRGGKLALTEEGRRRGRDVIRRHRLAERLLADVLSSAEERMEEDACRFEHILQNDLADRVCVLLGHPRTCPHGKPIPEGECCRTPAAEAAEEVVTLADSPVGARGQVAYLATEGNREAQKLMAMGVLPGVSIELIQRSPSYVFQLGFSQFTIDRALAESIHVRRAASAVAGRTR